MRWPEIDLDKKIWTVPADRMKAGREHRVPLSPRAVAILRQLEKLKAGEFVFAGQARNKPLSNMAMEMVLRRMKIEDATVHGFRSSFRDWAGNVSNFPREITETALAHVIGDKAEQAYRRSDALEKRRKLMEAWASLLRAQKGPATSFKCLGRGKPPTTSHWRSFGPRQHNTVRCRKQSQRGYRVMGADQGKASALRETPGRCLPCATTTRKPSS